MLSRSCESERACRRSRMSEAGEAGRQGREGEFEGELILLGLLSCPTLNRARVVTVLYEDEWIFDRQDVQDSSEADTVGRDYSLPKT